MPWSWLWTAGIVSFDCCGATGLGRTSLQVLYDSHLKRKVGAPGVPERGPDTVELAAES